MKMEINEALEALNKAGLLAERLPACKRGNGVRWSGYTFRRPKANASYVKIMKVITQLDNSATKREIYDALGWEYSHGNRSGIFTALADEGYLAFDPATKKWSVTDEGARFIEYNEDAFDDTNTNLQDDKDGYV
jgi:hypothetical protein